jgi:type VI secretion system protein ImpK
MRLVDCFMEPLTFTEYLLTSPNIDRLSYADVAKQYDRLFFRSHECVQNNGFSDADRISALFAVCAWIDERILCSAWSGREKWASAPLQRIHFSTANAGREFFQRLEGLAEDDRDVREVYAYSLALGFRGRFFSKESEEELKKILEYHAGLLGDMDETDIRGKLFPGAYDEKVRKGRGKKWFRLFSFSRLPFILIPIFFFAALFVLYRFMLQKMTAGFIGTTF